MLSHVLLSIWALLMLTIPAESLPAVNQAIRNKIEELRSQMPCGIGNGPPLVPYLKEILEINFTQSNFEAHGVVQNLQIDHLDEFIVKQIDFNLLRMRLDFAVKMPVVHAIGQYNLSSANVNDFEIWGDGPFEITAHNLTLNGYLKLNTIKGHLNMKEFVPTFLVGAFSSNIKGIFGGGVTDDLYNAALEHLVPEMLQSHKVQVGQLITKSVMGPVNKVLNTMTIADVIGLMRHKQRRPAAVASNALNKSKTCVS